MQRHQYDPQTQEGWKSYPIRLTTNTLSECHGKPQILVQSMSGGYVKKNCAECGSPNSLSLLEFQTVAAFVACPQCRKAMAAGMVPDRSGGERNYGFRCDPCGLYIWLADLLPSWQEAT